MQLIYIILSPFFIMGFFFVAWWLSSKFESELTTDKPADFRKSRVVWAIFVLLLSFYLFIHFSGIISPDDISTFPFVFIQMIMGYNIFTPRKKGEYHRYCVRSCIFPGGILGVLAAALELRCKTPTPVTLILELLAFFLLLNVFPRESHHQKYLRYMEKHSKEEPKEQDPEQTTPSSE